MDDEIRRRILDAFPLPHEGMEVVLMLALLERERGVDVETIVQTEQGVWSKIASVSFNVQLYNRLTPKESKDRVLAIPSRFGFKVNGGVNNILLTSHSPLFHYDGVRVNLDVFAGPSPAAG